MTSNKNAPLAGLTVLDLTHMLSGPYGTMTLADLGARTIKIEPPGEGEGTRKLLAESPDYAREGMGAYFLTLNRGKESIALDLKSTEGRSVFYDLVQHADIVFDNFTAGVTRRLGIDHDTLAAINPRIITCTVSGFGETGPDTQRPAFDQVVQAMGGGMSITGEPSMPPTRSGIPIGDLGGGIFGAMGVLAAVVARHSTGKGQHVDVSMLDVQISLLNYMATMHLMSGHVPDRIGNGHFVHVPYNVYATKDGHVVVACIGDAFFERFREMLPLPTLLNPAYARQPARLADKALIDAAIGEAFATQSTAHWLDRLRGARIPCGPVNDFAQALSDPQVLARNMVVSMTLDSGEVVRMPGNPMKFSDSAEACYAAPPRVGRDSQRILSEMLGYDDDRIDALQYAGAVGV
ncbi:CaiB/BaiF CoA transferase family protein [Variovorax ginsengisoli]|uniref:CoA transferase n=1 Tax=Variovorax ginsengisoli TaxID=363844 RepID=A0ABT8SHH8_9BURK|nr:CoA transferase [Variovorax ginsengisoli]MDN8618492.1 CoA transferase [Variovorax ginsengisoli]MDO1537662.1 CoA transferase [Variovorax ginsengisoli]